MVKLVVDYYFATGQGAWKERTGTIWMSRVPCKGELISMEGELFEINRVTHNCGEPPYGPEIAARLNLAPVVQ
jgi:hypothetical protein